MSQDEFTKLFTYMQREFARMDERFARVDTRLDHILGALDTTLNDKRRTSKDRSLYAASSTATSNGSSKQLPAST